MVDLPKYKIVEVRLSNGAESRLLIQMNVHMTLGNAMIDYQGLVRIHEMTGQEVFVLEDGQETLRIGKGYPIGGKK
jgi:hypothetical protein